MTTPNPHSAAAAADDAGRAYADRCSRGHRRSRSRGHGRGAIVLVIIGVGGVII